MTALPASRSVVRLALLCVALFHPASASAQFDTAQISGTVRDNTGGVLPGVDVVLVAEGTGLERRTVTNEAGLYTFANTPVGDFNSDRSKLFFFWGEEWDRIRSVQNQQATVPSAAMRNGDFSELLNPANPYFRAVRRIRDPLTGLPCTAADQRGCFPGNVIPRDRISPNGLALLNSYPLPTPGFQQGTNNWIGTPSTFDDTRKDSIKIDYVPAGNHRIAVRHTWAPHVWNDPESATAFSSIWDTRGGR